MAFNDPKLIDASKEKTVVPVGDTNEETDASHEDDDRSTINLRLRQLGDSGLQAAMSYLKSPGF